MGASGLALCTGLASTGAIGPLSPSQPRALIAWTLIAPIPTHPSMVIATSASPSAASLDDHTYCGVGTSGLALCTGLASADSIGHLRPTRPRALTTWTSISLISTRPSSTLATSVFPSAAWLGKFPAGWRRLYRLFALGWPRWVLLDPYCSFAYTLLLPDFL